MAERVNITIPDSLHSRIQAIKDRLNVSSVCQQALELVVSIEEARMKAGKEGTIDRLRLQRQQAQDEWFQAGKAYGLESASDLDYGDFEAIAASADEDLINGDEFDWIADAAQEQECPPHLSNVFYKGAFEGIREFWSSIEDEVLAG